MLYFLIFFSKNTFIFVNDLVHLWKEWMMKEVYNLRFIVVLIWSFLISCAASYVLTSMAGEPFNINHTLILTVFFFFIVTIIGEVVLKEESN